MSFRFVQGRTVCRPEMRKGDTQDGSTCGHGIVLSQARAGPGFAAEAEVWEVMTLTPPGPPARGGRAGMSPQGTLRPPSSPQLPGPEGASPLKGKAECHPLGERWPWKPGGQGQLAPRVGGGREHTPRSAPIAWACRTGPSWLEGPTASLPTYVQSLPPSYRGRSAGEGLTKRPGRLPGTPQFTPF